MTQFIPRERIVDVFPVPQFKNKLWESRSFFCRSESAAPWSRSWCTSTTDHGEKVEVISLCESPRSRSCAQPMLQLPDLPGLVTLGNWGIISTSPVYLTVTCPLSEDCLRRVFCPVSDTGGVAGSSGVLTPR